MPSNLREDVSTVISLVPLPINEVKPGLIPPAYHIDACKDPHTSCSILVILRAQFSVYIDETRPTLTVPEPSDRVAESICRDLKVSWGHYVPDVVEPGLFWIRGAYKPAEILSSQAMPEIKEMLFEAREKQMKWFSALVAEADDLWSRHRARRMISDLQRAAAKHLALQRDWDLSIEIKESLSVCKYCRADVHPEAMVCKACNGILDMVRYEKEFKSAATK